MSEITVNKIKILSGTQLQISGQVAGVAATQQDQFVTLAQISTTTEGGVTQAYVNAEVGNALQIAKTHSDNNDTEQTDTLTELMVSKDTIILTAAKVYADSLVTSTEPPTYVVTEKDTTVTNGVVYDLGDEPFAINGSFNAGAGGRQDSYVDYTFYTNAAGTTGGSATRRIGGLLDNGNDGGSAITAWIPFTIFIPTLGETVDPYQSIKFTFTGIISDFVVHTEVNLV